MKNRPYAYSFTDQVTFKDKTYNIKTYNITIDDYINLGTEQKQLQAVNLVLNPFDLLPNLTRGEKVISR